MSEKLDLPLGDLFAYQKTFLFSDPELSALDEIIISLALIYNDLKTFLMIFDHFKTRFPIKENKTIDKDYGQSIGIKMQMYRITTGIIEELFELIERKEKLFDHTIWRRTLNKLKKQDRELLQHWDILIKIATGQKMSGDFGKHFRVFLSKVRGHTFHYYQTKPLKQGYLSHFDGTSPEAEQAYVCYGKNMQETRFFFADAAMEKVLQGWMEKLPPNFDSELNQFIFRVHQSIKYIIQFYFDIKMEEKRIIK